MTILGIIAPTMASAIVLGLKVTSATTAQLAASHNRQLEAGFFSSDVQSARDDRRLVLDRTARTCMSAGQTLVGRLSWTDVDATGTATARAVTYATQHRGGDAQLVRNACTGATLPRWSLCTSGLGQPRLHRRRLRGSRLPGGRGRNAQDLGRFRQLVAGRSDPMKPLRCKHSVRAGR